MKKLMAVFLCLLMGLALSACTSTPGQPEVNLAIVVGAHANAPTPTLQGETVYNCIMESTASYGSVCVVVDDGAPYAVAEYDIAAPTKNLSTAKRAEIAQEQTAQIMAVMAKAAAVTPEVDVLSGIELAARALQDKTGERILILLESGLSTAGYMDFTQNLLYASTETVLSYLESKQAIPDLTGTSVIWVGLGDVAGIQKPLTPTNKNSLQELWSAVLYAGGATSVEFAADLPSAAPVPETLPYVTPVTIVEDASLVIDTSELSFDTPLVLGEEKVLFLPDSPEFADVEAVQDILRPIAGYMKANPGFQLLLAGTTATAGSQEGCVLLSFQRANAVRDVLLSIGVDPKQLCDPVGLGYEHPFHVPDTDPNGQLNENAPLNRSVILLDAQSEEARQIME